MKLKNKELGNLGESLAQKYISEAGYIILDKNFRCNIGEIDIIAKDDSYIVFIEVKTRRTTTFGYPSEAVDKRKQFKLINVSQYYILKKKLFNFDFRFDVIEVLLNSSDSYSIRLIKNAF